MRVLHAPTLGWRDVDPCENRGRGERAALLQIENSGRACALSQIRGPFATDARPPVSVVVFVSVSDGVGVGVHRSMVTCFAAVTTSPVSSDMFPCPFTARGVRAARTAVWRRTSPTEPRSPAISSGLSRGGGSATSRQANFTVEDVIARARPGMRRLSPPWRPPRGISGSGWPRSSTRSIRRGCYVGGEITLAWDLIEGSVRSALAERALTSAAAKTEIRPSPRGIPSPEGRRRSRCGASVRGVGGGVTVELL